MKKKIQIELDDKEVDAMEDFLYTDIDSKKKAELEEIVKNVWVKIVTEYDMRYFRIYKISEDGKSDLGTYMYIKTDSIRDKREILKDFLSDIPDYNMEYSIEDSSYDEMIKRQQESKKIYESEINLQELKEYYEKE